MKVKEEKRKWYLFKEKLVPMKKVELQKRKIEQLKNLKISKVKNFN